MIPTSTDILLFLVCQEFVILPQSSSHLNSQCMIGDVQLSHDEKCVVHFEEEDLEPLVVKIVNLRVQFDTVGDSFPSIDRVKDFT